MVINKLHDALNDDVEQSGLSNIELSVLSADCINSSLNSGNDDYDDDFDKVDLIPAEGDASKFFKAAIAIVGGGGFIFGYDIGVIAGTLDMLSDHFNMSFYEEGLTVSILYAGSILGCLIGFDILDRFGRWNAMHIQNVVFVIGGIITAAAPNISTLCAGRFIVGIAAALSGMTDSTYLMEIAPASKRGYLTGWYEILINVGVVSSFILGFAFLSLPNNLGWRIAFAIPIFCAILQSVAVYLYMPETPKWLISKGRAVEARQALCLMYGIDPDSLDEATAARIDLLAMRSLSSQGQSASKESSSEAPTSFFIRCSIFSSKKGMRCLSQGSPTNSQEKHTADEENTADKENTAEKNNEREDENDNQSKNSTVSDLMTEYRYPIFVIVAIQTLAQFTGGVVIRNYAPEIFKESGISTHFALALNIVLGLVKLGTTVWAVTHVEDLGRKQLLLRCTILVGFGMVFLTLASAAGGGSLNSPYVYLIGSALCLGGYGIAWGPVPWIMSTEMFPTKIRGKIISVSLLASNIAQLITNFAFLPLVGATTAAGVFFVFVVFNVVTYVWVRLYVTETREISPSQILKELEVQFRRKKWR